MDSHPIYPEVSKELVQQRRELAPDTMAAFRAFNQQAFADGALSAKMKDIIAVAVAHVTQCPYCIRGHTESAMKKGATEAELMEAGAVYAHSLVAIDTMQQVKAKAQDKS